jgi:hypothetical protein
MSIDHTVSLLGIEGERDRERERMSERDRERDSERETVRERVRGIYQLSSLDPGLLGTL